MSELQLTPIQIKFIKAVMEAVHRDEELIRFVHSKASGKTTVLNFIDKEFDFMNFTLQNKQL
jgi:hypothetical protein